MAEARSHPGEGRRRVAQGRLRARVRTAQRIKKGRPPGADGGRSRSPWQRVRVHLDLSYREMFCQHEWSIGVVQSPIHAFLDPTIHPRVQWLPSPRHGNFLADPFGAIRDGRCCVLCEEFDYRTKRGVISAFEFVPGGGRIQTQIAIDEPFHLSYPYLVEYDGDLYCVPEAASTREVAVYRAVDFPLRWTRVGTAIRGVSTADNTIFEHEGRWWLACVDDDDPPNERLLLWHAPTPLGPWEPHAANPVKIDDASARPAGTPFMFAGSLYRPAQDCSRTYGGRIIINRVRRLSPTEFDEEPVAVVEPDRSSPYPEGIHTISSVGDVTLIDGLRTAFLAPALPRAARHEIRRTFDAIRTILL